ncbi:hypothetical protein MNB_SM-4-258 [hydrothermal vent metagenome]|uniref:BIG2 domain-containing protein n=1 Tax=hydrothermal vent metagenome TaxID=652676 RepID=A0A1W1BQL1_9ZZZZ
MQYLKNLSFICLSTFIISCGDNTTLSPLKDVTSINLDDTNISIYATQAAKTLTATVTYNDGTTADASIDFSWESLDSSIFNASTASIVATSNGGDANLSIDYQSTFNDYTSVHVKKLLTINYSDLNISDIGNPQIIYVSGNYENNESNISMENNILWTVDSNATLTDVNASQMTITVDYNVTSILLKASLFYNTSYVEDFNKTFY